MSDEITRICGAFLSFLPRHAFGRSGFSEIPENLKWIVMGVIAAGLAIYLVRNLSR
jgi:hypothetical protein